MIKRRKENPMIVSVLAKEQIVRGLINWFDPMPLNRFLRSLNRMTSISPVEQCPWSSECDLFEVSVSILLGDSFLETKNLHSEGFEPPRHKPLLFDTWTLFELQRICSFDKVF